MLPCIFCKIANNEIPSSKVYEDNNFIAFLDINPVNKGHTLVVPKQHVETFLDASEQTLDRLMLVCQKLANAIVKATKADGFNLMLNNKRAAGQLVDHMHFHIIPRFNDDGLKHWQKKQYEQNEANSLVKKIKSLL